CSFFTSHVHPLDLHSFPTRRSSDLPVRAGDTLLQPGMYQLQHVIEGNDHVVIFKTMEMPAGYRHSNTPVSKEVTARIQCKVVPADRKSTRLNSSHLGISYAVFCLKK